MASKSLSRGTTAVRVNMTTPQLPDREALTTHDQFAHLPDGHLVPDDGICPGCGRLKQGHAGVEELLAARGLKGIPYCRCNQRRVSEVKTDLSYVVIVRRTEPTVTLATMRWRLLWDLLTRRDIEITVGMAKEGQT